MTEYRLVNEKYGNEPAMVTIDELEVLLRDVFDAPDTELVERAGDVPEDPGAL